ncbi:MAG: hypothetical protein NW220_11440 [Leptolyngbyaceae cyanobacterium bins.349]|nr:hypothetical protein [Leptolyngbyaceae cyanobacterium bins.349]
MRAILQKWDSNYLLYTATASVQSTDIYSGNVTLDRPMNSMFKGEIMPTHPKKSRQERVLLLIGIMFVSGLITVGVFMLAKEGSRILTNSIFYPSAWR